MAYPDELNYHQWALIAAAHGDDAEFARACEEVRRSDIDLLDIATGLAAMVAVSVSPQRCREELLIATAALHTQYPD